MGGAKPNCGICGDIKVRRRDRLVCMACNRRYAKEYAKRKGKKPSTPETRRTKAKYRNTVRPTGLTNNQVSAIKKRYGMSEAMYLKLRKKHKDRCSICQNSIASSPVIDHDHNTGAVRGLLCRRCNLALGMMQDDAETLRAAASYLEHRGAINHRDMSDLAARSEHNAFADALWNQRAWEFLASLSAPNGRK